MANGAAAAAFLAAGHGVIDVAAMLGLRVDAHPGSTAGGTDGLPACRGRSTTREMSCCLALARRLIPSFLRLMVLALICSLYPGPSPGIASGNYGAPPSTAARNGAPRSTRLPAVDGSAALCRTNFGGAGPHRAPLDSNFPYMPRTVVSSELRRLGDALIAHVRPPRSVVAIDPTTLAKEVRASEPAPHQHAIDVTHFEANEFCATGSSPRRRRHDARLDADRRRRRAVGWASWSSFTHVCLGLRRTRAGARVGNAPVA